MHDVPMPSPRQPFSRSEVLSGSRLLTMLWSNRLFLHWPVDPAALRARVPSQLDLDLVKGRAWIGVVAFRITNVRALLAPPVPGLSSFNEVNVRVCVTHRGEPGVYFLSLDASNLVAVWAARTFLHLPYFRARVQVGKRAEAFRFSSRRCHQSAIPADFECTWTAGRPLPPPRRGDLAHFLTERAQTFVVHRGRVHACSVEHEAWPLREAKVLTLKSNLLEAAGLSDPTEPPVAWHSDALAVSMSPIRELRTSEVASGLLDPAMSPPPAALTRRRI